MKAWFAGLAPRERVMVVVGGAVGTVVLLYLLVVEPTAQAFAERQQRVQSLEQQLTWMRETAAEAQALRAQGRGTNPGEGGDRPPYVVVDAALENAGLPAPSRLEPAGNEGAARLEFEQVPFDPLVQLLARLQSDNGLQVTRARVQRGENGQVGAQLTLERPR